MRRRGRKFKVSGGISFFLDFLDFSSKTYQKILLFFFERLKNQLTKIFLQVQNKIFKKKKNHARDFQYFSKIPDIIGDVFWKNFNQHFFWEG